MRHACGCLIVARDTGAILLVRRSAAVSHRGEWGIPGGGYEPTDLGLAQCALRETMEEAKLAPRIVGPLAAQDSRHRRFVTFLATLPRAVEPLLNWEHDAWEWCRPMSSIASWNLPLPLYTMRDGHGLADLLLDPDVFAAAMAARR